MTYELADSGKFAVLHLVSIASAEDAVAPYGVVERVEAFVLGGTARDGHLRNLAAEEVLGLAYLILRLEEQVVVRTSFLKSCLHGSLLDVVQTTATNLYGHVIRVGYALVGNFQVSHS